jgi:hypothetical protein
MMNVYSNSAATDDHAETFIRNPNGYDRGISIAPQRLLSRKNLAVRPPFLIQRGHLRELLLGSQPTLFAKPGLTGLGMNGPEKWFFSPLTRPSKPSDCDSWMNP